MVTKEWKGKTEGTPCMHRCLIAALKYMPLWFVYAGAFVFVIPFYIVFAHQGYISMYHFFRKRFKEDPLRSFLHTYLNHCRFAQVILDRFYVYGGGRFRFEIDHPELYEHLAKSESGFMIMSAHVGNYEIAGYTLMATDKRINALVFGAEAETVMRNRQRIFAGNNLRMIPIKGDMSHLFLLNDALADGESVSIPSDRIFGSRRHLVCNFMEAPANFPLGPFLVAVQRDLPVISIHVMKTGIYRYNIYIKQFETARDGSQTERAKYIANQYVAFLESIVRKYPTQWFNYYEFWN